jgi:hypothetical protein
MGGSDYFGDCMIVAGFLMIMRQFIKIEKLKTG